MQTSKGFVAALTVVAVTSVAPFAWSEEAGVQPQAIPQATTEIPAETSAEAPSSEASPTLTGQVSTTVMGVDYFQIAKDPTPMKEYSERKYQAVTITLQNKQAAHVELLQGEVSNALDETLLAQEKAQSKARGMKMAGFALRGASVVPGLGMMGVGSYSTALALAHTQNALSHASYIVDNTPTGGQAISGKYVQRFSNIIIPPNQTFTFKALVPKDTSPAVKLIFKDLKTNQIFDITQ